jgi:CRISPR-associated endonuclease Csn1
MEQKILGIDLGTNSLGIALRNIDKGGNITNQLDYYSSIIFNSGVGKDTKGEYSYAAERTKYRSTRRLYQSRKYRIWATLKLLIVHGCCPLSEDNLKRWSKYDKEKGLKREYPIDVPEFEQWVRLDFDGDDIADYSSPYQLRAELLERHLDWNSQIDRYKFGRAMYHIAQRRGFKSSKGETLKDAGDNEDLSTIEVESAMKKSEEKKSKGIAEFMNAHNLETVGCAFAKLEKDGIRVRNHPEYQAVQSQYREEVEKICRHQHIDTLSPELYRGLMSTKKGEGTIFYRRPLRSQKGNIGKCTLEPTKRRCPVSHPDYEEYRALSFINNIKYRISPDEEWKNLTDTERWEIFDTLFCRAKSTFKFVDIRAWIEKSHNGVHLDYNSRTINYRDYTTVAGCPIISRLKKILGNEWRIKEIITVRERTNNKSGEIHKVSYNYEDLWHLSFSCDDYEDLYEFVQIRLGFNETQAKEMTRMWSSLQDGYTTLSLKAIRNILPFLREGMIYSDAVSLAKIPDIIGKERWVTSRDSVLSSIEAINNNTAHNRLVYNLTNTVISNYKALSFEEQFAYKNTNYTLTYIDREDILQCCIDYYGEKRWGQISKTEQISLQNEIARLYQLFFASSKREYYKLPKTSDTLKEYLSILFPDINNKDWDNLYHHSQISLFPQAQPKLGTPDIGSIKNPVVLRALHVLRKAINALLTEGMVDEDTRIVVETAREMNDANWRRAIERYQKEREKENAAIAEIIREFRPNYTDSDIDKGRLLFEQNIIAEANRDAKQKAERFALDLQKYKLWKEQNFQCLYTGKHISVSDLFDDSVVDIEHTIPRSFSFDDSLSNKTVCFAHFNRYTKNNQIPSELSNYNEILLRIKPWEDKLEHIMSQIELWKGKARTAPTIERKNECLQQKHQWELERDYWRAKINTFTIQKDEMDLGFRNSQLVDTRIISKYAFHYLKSVFNRVDVEKGNVTATFRKILGVQSVDEKKDRSKHSHHAIDAAILTIVPTAAKRDKMMELYYKLEDAPDSEKENFRIALQQEVRDCRIGSANGLLETIEKNILVNHITKDQTLAPSHKRRRINGHVIEGQWQTGDSIRGSLHKDTFYGAIKSPTGDLFMVKRTPLKNMSEKDIVTIVDERLKEMIRTQLKHKMEDEGLSASKAMESDFYMLDTNGNPITQDRNGRPIAPLRHVRCYAKAGRGFLKIDTALPIKRQTYPSKQEHKNTYYAQNDDNYLCLFYEGMVKGKVQRAFRLVNYLDVAKLNLKNENTLFREPEFAHYEGSQSMPLRAIIKKGTRVLLFANSPDEIPDLDNDALSKRLFIAYKFNTMGTPTIYLRHHSEARPETQCDSSEKSSSFDATTPFSYLSLKASNFKALIEHSDFEIDPLGNIVFK